MAMRLSRSIVGKAEAEATSRVLLEDGYLGMGNETRLFEQELAAYLGVQPEQIVSTNSGTAALHLAVDAIAALHRGKISGQPEVLVPSLTFVSSFQAISAAGCRPVACDVIERSATIDLDDAEKKIGDNTIAIMPVHYASNPWKLDRIYDFAASHGLRVIEDAAHAFACRHHGRLVGSFGDMICFSFDGIKNITCGEGGCIVGFDQNAIEIASNARLLSVNNDAKMRFAGTRSWDPDVCRQGWRYHLSNIMAAIGRVQLSRLDKEFAPARRNLASIYRSKLGDLPGIALLETDPDDYIVPHIQPVRIFSGKKEKVQAELAKKNIPTGIHYKPNHLLSFFGNGKPHLPVCEQLFSELLTLPLHPGLSEDDISHVCSSLAMAIEQ